MTFSCFVISYLWYTFVTVNLTTMRRRLLLLIFLTLFLTPLVKAQETFDSRYNIHYITTENGLLHNFIDDIYKDSRGFLWVSTAGGGLSRYDGYEFVHYNSSHPRAGIKGNFVTSVVEDDFQRLWILSDGGTHVLDLNQNRLIELDYGDKTILRMLSQPGIRVMKDSQGNIWVCTVNSLHRITFRKDGTVDKVNSLTALNMPIQLIAIKDIDADGCIWLGIKNNIYKLYPQDNGGFLTKEVSPLLKLEPWIYVTCFLLKENEVWIGTNEKLIRYSRNEEVRKDYVSEKNNNRSLTQNHVTDLAVTADKQLLVSTLKGLNIYNPVKDDFERLNYEESITSKGLNSDFINCLYVDNDIIWIGTESGGINKLTQRRLLVRNYIHDHTDPSSLSKNIINAIYEDSDRNLWIGTVEGGLNRKTPNGNSFVHYNMETPSRLAHNTVSGIVEDENKHLWIASWGKGISIMNLNKPGFPIAKYISANEYPEIRAEFIGAMTYDPINKGVWIGANPGVYFYDIQADTIITPLPEEINRNIRGSIGSIIDKDNHLWIGSMEGVYIIDLYSRLKNKFSYRHFKYKLNDPSSGLKERISCFYMSSDSTLWIGSNGYGIYKYQPENVVDHRFISYDTSKGLINDNVRGILEDDHGNLWISTINGLSCFDVRTERFTSYTEEDGLVGNQFYWNAFYKTKDGTLYFGGVKGLTAIDGRRENIANDKNPSITFTNLRIANENIFAGNNKYISEDITVSPVLRLHESDKSFSLEFSALNFEQQSTAVYSYKLSGFDDQWTEVPANRRFANYTNLPPGKYKFQVKYVVNEDSSNVPVKELEIIVTPYFYKTKWFILMVILTVLLTTYYLYRRRISKLQRQKEILYRKVEERTKELKQQKVLLEKQTNELSEQNEMLIRQNNKITKQKSQLIQMSKKVQELTLDKISFFTNITHEFRTPITLIIGPIERALKLSYNPQVIEQLSFVERNSKYLLSLVNQLMDFRKVESGKMRIHKRNGDFIQFIHSIIVPFEVFAQERNIEIKTFFRLSNPNILFDSDAMHKVMTNLLSNAIKFTPDGGQVTIYIASVNNNGKENLYISVKDTGTGIPQEDIDKIFDRFYQSHNNVKFPVYGQSGTGIGLYLSKRIILLHNGTIKVRNNRNAGSNFRILMPVERSSQPNAADEITPNVPVIAGNDKKDTELKDFNAAQFTILVVEDNKDMRSYIRSILKEYYNVLEAENGKVAYEILTTTNVDFIISDLMMPVMDGLELSQRVKGNFAISHIPFLMLTAKISEESRLESYKTGVDAYLSKPFNEELLLARIDNILENRKRYQRQFASHMNVDALNMEEESSDRKFLNKALDIVKANYSNSNFDVSEFIDAMALSKSMLNKKLQNLTGQSIGQFIRNYRLNTARELIEKNRSTRNMNISEIAYEVGFNDPKYFTRCFTKRFNVPPSSLLDL